LNFGDGTQTDTIQAVLSIHVFSAIHANKGCSQRAHFRSECSFGVCRRFFSPRIKALIASTARSAVVLLPDPGSSCGALFRKLRSNDMVRFSAAGTPLGGNAFESAGMVADKKKETG
jgi:hypothetical protein